MVTKIVKTKTDYKILFFKSSNDMKKLGSKAAVNSVTLSFSSLEKLFDKIGLIIVKDVW